MLIKLVFRAVWVPVERREEKSGTVVWNVGDAFNDDDLEEEEDYSDPTNYDYEYQGDGNEYLEPGNGHFRGNFGFPFPDPDAVMAGYLGDQQTWYSC